MRDIVVVIGMLVLLAYAAYRPILAIYIWTWFSLLSPHRVAFGFSYDIPFNKMIAAITLMVAIVSNEPRKLPGGIIFWALMLFWFWTTLTTFTGEWFDHSWSFYKSHIIPVIVHIILVLIFVNTKLRLHALVWCFCLALGWHAGKIAIVTIIEGGSIGGSEDFGPPETMISDRNHFALALVMTLPLMFYLYRTTPQRWMRNLILLVSLCALIAVIGTSSRGGFAAMIVMLAYLWWKSRNKFVYGAAITGFLMLAFFLMPQEWKERVYSIASVTEKADPWSDRKDVGDLSFNQRTMVWGIARKMAADSPILGKGIRAVQLREVGLIYYDETHPLYGTEWYMSRAAHSIYFEVLADSGYAGLLIFCALGVITWIRLAFLIRMTKNRPDFLWAALLASMLQVSFIGYYFGGALLSLAYYDGAHLLFCMAIILDRLVREELGQVPRRVPLTQRKERRREAGASPQDRWAN